MNIQKIAEGILKNAAETKFSTEVKDVTYKNIIKWLDVISKSDIDPSGNMTVYWTADIEMREWGIKSVGAYVQNVKGQIKVEFIDDDEERQYEFDALKEGFKIDSEILFKDDTMTPMEVRIDFGKKTVSVE